MTVLPTNCLPSRALQRCIFLVLLSLLLLIGCGIKGGASQEESESDLPSTAEVIQATRTTEPAVPLIDLTLNKEDLSLDPLPLRAGFPFTITAAIHNNADLPAIDVPVMIYVSPKQDKIGYTSFLHSLTVTLPASQTLPIEVPVDWNFSGGEHRLWVEVNRLPDAWQTRMPTLAEEDTRDNTVLLDLMIDPFDAYISDLCAGPVDVEVSPTDVLAEPDRQRVLVQVHNVGNLAVYNLPVIITGEQLTGITYTPAIPPCGGTAEVYVEIDRPFQEGETLTVQVNPSEWEGGLQEDRTDNNQVTVTAGWAAEEEISIPGGLEDYDFYLSTEDIEIAEPWTVLITAHNLGTRDAAMVPVRIENEGGRKLTDVIPLVQGEGIGVAAVRVGYLWIPGGTLTFTINPQEASGAYQEMNQENNVATFILP
jgi:hypothetical protein